MHISSRHSQAGRDTPRQQAALVCGSVGHSEHVLEKFADSFLVKITSILQGGPRKRPICLLVLVNEDVNMALHDFRSTGGETCTRLGALQRKHLFLADSPSRNCTCRKHATLCPKFAKAHFIKGFPFSFVEAVEDVMLNKSGKGVYFVVLLGVKYPQAAY